MCAEMVKRWGIVHLLKIEIKNYSHNIKLINADVLEIYSADITALC